MGKNICRIHVVHIRTHTRFIQAQIGSCLAIYKFRKMRPGRVGLVGLEWGVAEIIYIYIRYTVVEIILITFCALYGSAN